MLQRFKGPEGHRVFVEALEMQPVIGGRPELANVVCDSSQLESWAPGDSIIENGTPGNEIYFVLSGAVSIQVQGREVAVRQGGEQIGEMALLHPGQPRSATVVAIDETVTARLAEQEFSSWRTTTRWCGETWPESWRTASGRETGLSLPRVRRPFYSLDVRRNP